MLILEVCVLALTLAAFWMFETYTAGCERL
jgi:hypothetical protein